MNILSTEKEASTITEMVCDSVSYSREIDFAVVRFATNLVF